MVEQACMLIVVVTAGQFALGALVFSAGVEQVRRQQRAIEFNGRKVAAPLSWLNPSWLLSGRRR